MRLVDKQNNESKIVFMNNPGNLKENCSGQERPRAKSLATNLLYPHRPYAAQPYIEISSSVKKQPKQTEKKLSNNVEKPYKGGEDKKKVFETRKEQKFLKVSTEAFGCYVTNFSIVEFIFSKIKKAKYVNYFLICIYFL